ELVEPPGWVLSQGVDGLRRALDRIGWGTYGGVLAARDVLVEHGPAIEGELLARLRALGDSDPIQVSKLIAVLGELQPGPQGIAELVRRALSHEALVAQAALTALANQGSPAALGGILDRRFDP